MRSQRTVEIEGYTYLVDPLGAVDGAVLLSTIVEHAGAGLFVALGRSKGPAAMTAIGRSPALVKELCLTFGRLTTLVGTGQLVKGSETAVFDLHFSGRYTALLVWLADCLKAEFGPLVEEMSDTDRRQKVLERLGLVVPTQSTAPADG